MAHKLKAIIIGESFIGVYPLRNDKKDSEVLYCGVGERMDEDFRHALRQVFGELNSKHLTGAIHCVVREFAKECQKLPRNGRASPGDLTIDANSLTNGYFTKDTVWQRVASLFKPNTVNVRGPANRKDDDTSKRRKPIRQQEKSFVLTLSDEFEFRLATAEEEREWRHRDSVDGAEFSDLDPVVQATMFRLGAVTPALKRELEVRLSSLRDGEFLDMTVAADTGEQAISAFTSFLAIASERTSADLPPEPEPLDAPSSPRVLRGTQVRARILAANLTALRAIQMFAEPLRRERVYVEIRAFDRGYPHVFHGLMYRIGQAGGSSEAELFREARLPVAYVGHVDPAEMDILKRCGPYRRLAPGRGASQDLISEFDRYHFNSFAHWFEEGWKSASDGGEILRVGFFQK